MNFKNIVLSMVLAGGLTLSYVTRYALGGLFQVIFFGLILVGGALLAINLRSKEVKYDERTAYLTGKAAKATILGSFLLGLAILLYIEFAQRPTSANGVIAVMLGAMGVFYSVAYAYFEKNS